MVAAATLLASLYFGTYHAVTFLTMETRKVVFAACCVAAVLMLALKSQQFGWIIPLAARTLVVVVVVRQKDVEHLEKA